MARTFRLPLAAAVAVVAALVGVPRAFACGNAGYSYAGLGAPGRGFGISATLTSVADFDVRGGHVAAYVDVGGPGEGPGGSNEWLQIGLSRFPGVTGSDAYYEVALPGRFPVYHQLAAGLPAGRPVKVALSEIHKRPNWWRVWLNGSAASRPIRLPESHGRWQPIATAESWEGGAGASCENFLYNFRRIRIAHALGGGWHPLSGGRIVRSSGTHIRRRTGDGFFAVEGRAALRLLSSLPR
jgi:hypothetical protein